MFSVRKHLYFIYFQIKQSKPIPKSEVFYIDFDSPVNSNSFFSSKVVLCYLWD